MSPAKLNSDEKQKRFQCFVKLFPVDGDILFNNTSISFKKLFSFT